METSHCSWQQVVFPFGVVLAYQTSIVGSVEKSVILIHENGCVRWCLFYTWFTVLSSGKEYSRSSIQYSSHFLHDFCSRHPDAISESFGGLLLGPISC
jgi:hypothetical protein